VYNPDTLKPTDMEKIYKSAEVCLLDKPNNKLLIVENFVRGKDIIDDMVSEGDSFDFKKYFSTVE
jgi:hypothetical protein